MTEYTFTVGRASNRPLSSGNQMWEVTPIGESKINNYAGTDENPQFKVLSSLLSMQPASVDDVARDSNLGKDVVLHHLKIMSITNPPLCKRMESVKC